MQTVQGQHTHFPKKTEKDTSYSVVSESMGINEKLAILEKMGREDLIDIFKEWKPKQTLKKKKAAPLDQKVSITVTDSERVILDNELKAIKASGEKVTMSTFIRNRAIGSVDIQGWKEIAEKAIVEIEDIASNKKELREQKNNLMVSLDEEEDDERIDYLQQEIYKINEKLRKIISQNEKRNNRLSGRMSMQESEIIKWRAQRLCLSSSDYLRMMIFNLEPNTKADAHLSLDAKRRFYISIIDVANNGWGEPNTIYECSQCANYLDEIDRLQDRIKQLENFS